MTGPPDHCGERSGHKLTASAGSVASAPEHSPVIEPDRKSLIMTASLTPHLNFDGNAREALTFYATVLGTQPAIRTYGELGMPAGLPDVDKVVWGQVATADGVRIMAYDVPTQRANGAPAQAGATRRENGLTVTDQPYFLALSSATLDDAEKLWASLVVGATVLEPLAASAWSAGFGMLTDSFGVTWVIDVQSGDDYS
jgi:PhnB protein